MSDGNLILGDGSGGGGGGGDYTITGSVGGAGGSGNDSLTGSVGNDVIFGDGSGGGGGGSNPPASPSAGGLAGGGNDVIDGGSGNDIIFGDGFNGSNSTHHGGDGGFGGGGGGGGSYKYSAPGDVSFGGSGHLGGGDGGIGGGAFSTNRQDGENSVVGTSGGSSTYGAGGGAGLSLLATGGGVGGDGGDLDGGDPGVAGTNDSISVSDIGGLFYINVKIEVDAGNIESATSGTLSGHGAGNDTIDGGSGNDDLFGLGGADTFVMDLSDDDGTTDTIWDFDASESDVLRIITASDTIDITDLKNYNALTSDSDAETTANQNVGDDAEIYFADGSKVVIKDFAFTNEVPCFLTRTGIKTDNGLQAVESLAIGDSVLTREGSLETIKWIGKRQVAVQFSGRHSNPICIAAGALGLGKPSKDLFISPDHAMYLDGVLIQAQALVNGTSITQVKMTEDFMYYHIELERHALIYAEGAETETFVDADVRSRFDNSAEFDALYPNAEVVQPMTIPRIKSKRQLPSFVKQKLSVCKLVI